MISARHVVALGTVLLTANFLRTTMTINRKKNWRTSTALCVASTVLVATAAYAAHYPGGRSDWDKRPHHNHHEGQDGDHGGVYEGGRPMPTRTIPVATVYTENRVKSRLSRNDRLLAQGGPQEDQFCFR